MRSNKLRQAVSRCLPTSAQRSLRGLGCGSIGLLSLTALQGCTASVGPNPSPVSLFLFAVPVAAVWLLCKAAQSEQDSSLSISISQAPAGLVLPSGQILAPSGITPDEEPGVRQRKIKVHPAPELYAAKISSPPSVSVCPRRLVQYSAQSSTKGSPDNCANTNESRSGSTGTAQASKVDCTGCALLSSCILDKSITFNHPTILRATVKRRSSNG